MIIPDMTPWSYPKRKTPSDTKTLVKYLRRAEGGDQSANVLFGPFSHGLSFSGRGRERERDQSSRLTYNNGLPTNPCSGAFCPLRGDMMEARIRSVLEICRGGGFGIRMWSFSRSIDGRE
jgi:hypothetical protein